MAFVAAEGAEAAAGGGGAAASAAKGAAKSRPMRTKPSHKPVQLTDPTPPGTTATGDDPAAAAGYPATDPPAGTTSTGKPRSSSKGSNAGNPAAGSSTWPSSSSNKRSTSFPRKVGGVDTGDAAGLFLGIFASAYAINVLHGTGHQWLTAKFLNKT